MTTRLFSYLLARLRHETWHYSIRMAVNANLIEQVPVIIDGWTVIVFKPHTVIPDADMRKFNKALVRTAYRPSTFKSPWESSDLETEAGGGWSGTWAEPDLGSRKLTGYRQGGQTQFDENAVMPTIAQVSRIRRESVVSSHNTLLASIAAADQFPNPVDVTTILLTLKALDLSETPIEELSAKLTQPGVIISVIGEVEGFEKSFLSLLKRGIFGPPQVAILDGSRINDAGHFVVRKNEEGLQAIIFLGYAFEDKYADMSEEQLGKAAELGMPILGVTEDPGLLSERLFAASTLHLTTGPLTASLVRVVVSLTYGAETGGEILNDNDCLLLTLSDLALAIRPDITSERAFEVLKELASVRAGEGSADASSSSNIPSAQKLKWGAIPKTARGRKVHSGSELIQPQQRAEDEGNRSVPRVETLAGYGEAQTWAMDLKADLDLWRSGQLAWSDLSSRIVLSGPPGTGKTLFAKALANSLNIPLFATSVGTWLQGGHLNDVIERMDAAFVEAKAAKPCILLIDETDAVGGRRQVSAQGSDYWNSIVARLLELLDGSVKSTGVIVVGATNNVDLIDPALLRSGRLEKCVEIPFPDLQTLEEIFRFHLGDASSELEAADDAKRAVPLPQTSLRRFASMANGLTGADVERLVREARQVARRQERQLTHADIEAVIGKEKPIRNETVQRISAVHEAGHAIACLAVANCSVSTITLNGAKGRSYLEVIDSSIDNGSSQSMHGNIIICLSGRAAEEVILGRISRGSGGSADSDLAKATEIATALETSYGFNSQKSLVYLGTIDPFSLLAGRQDIAAAVNKRLDVCYDKAKALIDRNKDAVVQLADALMEHEVLEGEAFKEILDALVIA